MNYIHETVLRDIIDITSDLKDVDVIKRFDGRRKSMKSIAAASANLTLVFPVICSRAINIHDASMVAKAIERKATTMLQLLFAARQTHNSSDVYDYLKKFHTNLRIDNNITVDGMMELMDKLVTESTGTDYILSEMEIKEMFRKDSKNLNSYLEENINEKSILNYSIIPAGRYGRTTIIENDNQVNITKSSELNNIQQSNSNRPISGEKKSDKVSVAKNHTDIFKNSLLSSDIKKANELVPTTLVVNVTLLDKEGKPSDVPITFIVGVKAKLYPVDSLDIMERLVAKNKDTNTLTKFIRATTREISFFKDFLFAIDQAKIDALSQSRRGSSSKMWKILERRAKKSKFKRNVGMENDAMAITTLVITQEEVEFIKKENNIDLENPAVIRPIMEAYNLMGFCILDETNEVAKFIFDTGEDLYEEMSYYSLERETQDGGYKKAINLMAKLAK